MRACICLAIALFTVSTARAVGARGDLAIFAHGASAIYLDIAETDAVSLNVVRPVQDLRSYFERMTGRPLPCREMPFLFDLTASEATRFECAIARMMDTSTNASDNATVALTLSPTTFFEGDTFAGVGDKVSWECTWHRGSRQLEFGLRVANKPYYGPGYGPYTFVRLTVPTVSADEVKGLHLALDIRHQGAEIRGGYSLNGTQWVYTDWFDPTKAGTDTRDPGKSERNGPQAWSQDWTQRWKNATAFFITGYGTKGRSTSIWIGDAKVTQGANTLFTGSFDNWTKIPARGTATPEGESVLLQPTVGTWSMVGLRATRRLEPGNLIPLRLELGTTPSAASSLDPTKTNGYAMVVSPKEIVLRALTRLGLQNAIYSLLDRWGCRWVLPGALGEVIPHRDSLTLSLGTTTSAPRYDPSVEANGRGGDYADWYNRNQCGWEKWLSGQHYWGYALPPEKHFADHPEWYALISGKRVPTQLCTSNPEVIARVIEVGKTFLRNIPHAISFPLDPNDNIDFCQCDRCRAQDPPGVGKDGNPLMTDRVVRFANAVAEGIREEFPDRLVAFYAYSTHTQPPVNIKPASNVAIIIARGHYCLLHLQPDKRCPSSLSFHELIRKWSQLTPRIYTYEYDPISWTGFLPCPTFLERSRDARILLDDYGIKGGVTDRAPGQETAAATYINNFFERRMKADPNRDPDKELTEMCDGFFGPAAKPMEAYYRTLAKATDYLHPGRERVSIGTHRYHEMFSPKMVAAARRQINDALRVAGNRSPFTERVQFVEASQRYLEAYLDGVWSAQTGDYTRSVTAFERVESLIKEMTQSGSINPEEARGRMKTVRLKTLAEHFPDRLGMVRRWKLLGPFDNTQRDADMRTDPFEPVASIAGPVTSAGGAHREWWSYESRGGFVNLESALKDRKVSWKLSYLYAGLKLQTAQAAQVQLRMDSFFPFRVFLNGREVYHRSGLDADCPDKRIVSVDLPNGESTLVLKLSQTKLTSDAFPWGLYFRITDNQGNPIPSHWDSAGALALDLHDMPKAVSTFPTEWLFRKDPDGKGSKESWFKPGLEDRDWQRIPIGRCWEDTAAGAYDGDAWYRVKFSIAKEAAGKKLALSFDGVDEEAWVYMNGQLIGEHSVASTRKSPGELWEEPFTVPVKNARIGEENLLAVRVHDSAYAGGIYKPVSLIALP